ncbi:MAG: TrkA family potassium uptake protein [Lachnospiraceae bacterium]|nr:TrkA family potassium uptake protein [Lachnospiraceae bacterium]
MKNSIAVLGLGKYGRSLSENLYRMGADVLVVDCNEELIEDFSGKCTSAVCANLANEDEVMALGLKNMDIVVTAMGRNLAPSIMSVSVAKEQGVPIVVSKASSDRMAKILRKVGADKIIDPEGEGGERSARILMSSMCRDFYKLDDNMYMIEMMPKEEWVGRNTAEMEQLRDKVNLNIVAVRKKGQSWHLVKPGIRFAKDDMLLIVTEKEDISKIQ